MVSVATWILDHMHEITTKLVLEGKLKIVIKEGRPQIENK